MATLKVLIPLDGSSFSRGSLNRVYKTLTPKRHQLILMRVAPLPTGIGTIPPRMLALSGSSDFIPHFTSASELELNQHPIYETQAWESTKAQIESELNQDMQDLQKAGFDVVILIHFGDIPQEIVTAIKQRNIDLVVMATHGRKGLERMLLGSIAETVLQSTDVPVLMVRPDQTESLKSRDKSQHVLIPIDESDFSRSVLIHVMRLLRPVDYHITLLRVASMPELENPSPTPNQSLDSWLLSTDSPTHQVEIAQTKKEYATHYTRLINTLQTNLLDDMQSAGDFLREAGFKVELKVCFGKTATEIQNFITYQHVDMVMMATHSRKGLERLVLGSVTKEVFDHVHISIMMVKPNLEVYFNTLRQSSVKTPTT
jgi:nucleotide-binding universal stress UspA family protein